MSIYTRKGDAGTTSTIGSKGKISKSSCQTRALGAIDELNSFVGVVIAFSESTDVKDLLAKIQTNLLHIGSMIGGSDLKFSRSETTKLEKQIDEWDKILHKLSNFILPGGSQSAALLQYARTLARKAERETVTLNRKHKIAPQILMYLNRLSDYLFMIARLENYRRGIDDKIWER